MGKDWERTGEGLGKDWGRTGEGLGKDWGRTRKGPGKDWGRAGEGLGKDWERTGKGLGNVDKKPKRMSHTIHHSHRVSLNTTIQEVIVIDQNIKRYTFYCIISTVVPPNTADLGTDEKAAVFGSIRRDDCSTK